MPYTSLLRPGSVCRLNKLFAHRGRLYSLATIREAASGSIEIIEEAPTYTVKPSDLCVFLGLQLISQPSDELKAWNIFKGRKQEDVKNIWASILVDEKVLAWQMVSGQIVGLSENLSEEKKNKWLKQAATNFKVFFDVVLK